jgi:hypothetical protein
MEATLPDCLADWIDRKMPEVGGVRGIRIIFCDSLPFEWLPGDRSKIDGITLWGEIYLRISFHPIDPRDPIKVELLLHELVHVQQFRRNPLIFPINYLLEHVKSGYWNNPLEVEARSLAEKLIQEYLLEDVCGEF